MPLTQTSWEALWINCHSLQKNKKHKNGWCYCKSTVSYNSPGRDAHTVVKGRTIRKVMGGGGGGEKNFLGRLGFFSF